MPGPQRRWTGPMPTATRSNLVGLLQLLLLLGLQLPGALAFWGGAGGVRVVGSRFGQSRRIDPQPMSASANEFYGRSFQPLGTPMKKAEPEVAFKLGLQEETAGTANEEYIVNITKPLGIAIEEAADGSGMVYIVERGDKAAELGVEEGDVIVGCSFIFDDLFLANVTGKGAEKVESLIRSRGADYVCLRLRKGCDYHLQDRAEAEARRRAEEDEEELLEPEEKEARWIRVAQAIYADSFPIGDGDEAMAAAALAYEDEDEEEAESW